MSATNEQNELGCDSLVRPLRGLEKLCKLYGRMKCGNVMMAWDYANDVALPEKELRADKERWKQSERTRRQQMASSHTIVLSNPELGQ